MIPSVPYQILDAPKTGNYGGPSPTPSRLIIHNHVSLSHSTLRELSMVLYSFYRHTHNTHWYTK
jgi:hypothetical protein